MLLNLLRRTIIPPLWKLFQHIPDGTRFWHWCASRLGVEPRRPHLSDLDSRIVVREQAEAQVPLCKLANLPDFSNPQWVAAAQKLGIASEHANPDPVKKYWEYVHLIYGLEELCCLDPTAKVLSVGCGYEIPMLYLTGLVAHVDGIDLFEGSDDIQAPLEAIEHDFRFPVDTERLTLQRMDARSLEFDDESFDLVFSLSSIEHFGGNPEAAKAMQEMGRVLRPGGIAAVATELVLNKLPHPFFFSLDELDLFVIRPSGLSLVEPIDLSLSPCLLENPPRVDEVNRRPLLAELWGDVLFTSVMLFLVKGSDESSVTATTLETSA
jgi:SAM-dependent methyltransferase